MRTVIIILLNISLITSLKAKTNENKIPEVNNQNSILHKPSPYSGLYEGIIEVPQCCAVVDDIEGQVIIDVDSDPIIFIYGGVNLNEKKFLKLDGNVLTDIDENEKVYTLAIFEKISDKNIVKIRTYKEEWEEMEEKRNEFFVLNKTQNIEDVQYLILNYFEEYNRIENFWAKLKNAILYKDYPTIAELTQIPITVNAYVLDETERIIRSRTELITFYARFFDSSFELSITSPIRHMDNDPWKELAGNYVLYFSKSHTLISEVDGKYMITALLGVWG